MILIKLAVPKSKAITIDIKCVIEEYHIKTSILMNNTKFLAAIIFLIVTSSCGNETVTPAENIAPGNDPNFTITAHSDSGLTKANRKVVVFGIDIYAAAQVEDSKLLHAANVMAQYLDNDEDGTPDNQVVVDRMIAERAFLTMWKSESDLTEPPLSLIHI